MTSLGWCLTAEKSELKPSRVFHFLGWEWDSVSMTVRLPDQKAKAVRTAMALLLRNVEGEATTTARRLARVIGAASTYRLQITQASLHLHSLDKFMAAAIAKRRVGWMSEAAR